MTSFTTTQCTKELGIRKVLGASAAQLAALLAKDFTRFAAVAVAFIVALPLAYSFMKTWLEIFCIPDRAGLVQVCARRCHSTVAHALTVSFQALKTACTNPVEALRRE